MIATYHIKVNGRWVNPGEHYEETQTVIAEEKAPDVQKTPETEIDAKTEVKSVIRRGRKKAE